jgi:predicted RNA-binding protein YlqC (UPF0109 family)
MSTIDQQFVDFVVKSLVNNPDAVQVERRVDEKGVLLELTVDPEDLGRVIGKRGATAQSLRTLLRALGTKNDARYNLKIVDNGVPPSERPARDDQPAASSNTAVDDAVPTDDTPPVHDTATSDDLADLRDDEEIPVTAANRVSEDSSDRLSRTRAELDELDDLDI